MSCKCIHVDTLLSLEQRITNLEKAGKGEEMAKTDMAIKFEIEPIVKLHCSNTMCQHNDNNMSNRFTCNLKHVCLNEKGQCDNRTN